MYIHTVYTKYFGQKKLKNTRSNTANKYIYSFIYFIYQYIFRPVHLRRNVGLWTVITLYSTVQITVGQNYGQIVQDSATVQYDFDRNLAV
jgi:hypothetical protein